MKRLAPSVLDEALWPLLCKLQSEGRKDAVRLYLSQHLLDCWKGGAA